MNHRTPLAALLALLLGVGTSLAQVDMAGFADFAAGPIFDKFGLTLDSGMRTEAAGPFYYRQETADSITWGLPPFYSEFRQPGVDAITFDALPPFLVYHRFGTEYTLLLTPLLNIFGGRYQNDVFYRRAMLFPFYYRQVSNDPERNYLAFFPIYGTIKNKFQMSEFQFALFPIYAKSRRRDIVTENFLFPFFHTRTGNGLTGWQFWPLMGLEHKDVTYRTNLLGTVETVGGHEKLFLVWPFLAEETTGIGTANQQYYQALLPFFAQSKSPARTSTSYLFPLLTITDDREKQYREWDFPWPMFVIARGTGKTITRFFPLFNYGKNENGYGVSFLWPLYWHKEIHSPPLDRVRNRFLLYLYSDVREHNLDNDAKRRRLDAWPFFTYQRTWDGMERLQALAILEPILPGNETIRRSLSPLYALWRSERNTLTGATSQSLLWNLYRRDTTMERQRTSVLFGLFQRRKSPQEDVLRVFFIPFKNQRRIEATAATTLNRGNAASTFCRSGGRGVENTRQPRT